MGKRYPGFMDALMPLASLPTQISGRNRVLRRVIIDAIRSEPDWRSGNYASQPPSLRRGVEMLYFMSSNPPLRQQQMATLVKGDSVLDSVVESLMKTNDANNTLYQFEASRDYDPAPDLEKIRVLLIAINSAGDLINPPELGILDCEIKRALTGQAIILPP